MIALVLTWDILCHVHVGVTHQTELCAVEKVNALAAARRERPLSAHLLRQVTILKDNPNMNY